MEQVSLENLLDFLVLCERSGFIEFKLPLGGLRANLESLWKEIFPSPTENQPPKSPSTAAALLSSNPDTHSQEQTEREYCTVEQVELEEAYESDASSLFDIKTPELLGAPGRNRLWPPALNVSTDSRDEQFWTPCTTAAGGQESADTANSERLTEEEDSASPLTLSGQCPQEGSPAIEPTENEGLDAALSELNDTMASDHALDSHPPPFSLDIDSEDSDCSVYNSEDEAQERSKSNLGDRSVSFTHISESPVSLEQSAFGESSNVKTSCDSLQGSAVEEKELAPISHFQKNSVERRSPFVDISSDSSDEDESQADQKLEKMFSDLRIMSAKKSVPKHIPSRKSLAVFIVSDSEDMDDSIISENEDDTSSKENQPPHTDAHACTPPSLNHTHSPVYSTPYTPYTPYTGVAFWGASDGAASSISVTPAPSVCSPERRNLTYATPGSAFQLGPSRSQPPVVTPSASKNFSHFKNDMIGELYELFNSTIFENKLPADLEIKWNSKLRTTAGYCYYLGFGRARTARIELATKVCDSYNRIRDTLIHELCHAATWVIDGVKGGGHGRQWKAWAQKANTVHPELRPVTRCHNFEVAYKYTYKCTVCDFKIGRHSKSVNVKSAQCPYCLSKLELVPKMKADGTPAVRKLNQFAQFVKDNYGTVKSQSPWRSHKQVMERLKDNYHCRKTLDGSFSD